MLMLTGIWGKSGLCVGAGSVTSIGHFVHSLNHNLWSSYNEQDIVLGAGDTPVNKEKETTNSALPSLSSQGGWGGGGLGGRADPIQNKDVRR